MTQNLESPTQSINPLNVNHYEVLNVSTSANRTEIRESYVRLKNTYNAHNQALYSLVNDEEAQQMAEQIEEAFRILNDDHQRRRYDVSLGLAVEPSSEQQRRMTYESRTNVVKNDETQSVFSGAFSSGAFAGDAPELSFRATSVRASAPTPPSQRPAVTASVLHKPTRAEHSGTDEIKAKLAEILSSSELGDGATFKALRLACGVSEDEMQDRTKICVEHIKAIESNTLERLPRMIFVKGFLRSYCKYLAVPDSEKLVAAFIERLEQWQTAQSLKD